MSASIIAKSLKHLMKITQEEDGILKTFSILVTNATVHELALYLPMLQPCNRGVFDKIAFRIELPVSYHETTTDNLFIKANDNVDLMVGIDGDKATFYNLTPIPFTSTQQMTVDVSDFITLITQSLTLMGMPYDVSASGERVAKIAYTNKAVNVSTVFLYDELANGLCVLRDGDRCIATGYIVCSDHTVRSNDTPLFYFDKNDKGAWEQKSKRFNLNVDAGTFVAETINLKF